MIKNNNNNNKKLEIRPELVEDWSQSFKIFISLLMNLTSACTGSFHIVAERVFFQSFNTIQLLSENAARQLVLVPNSISSELYHNRTKKNLSELLNKF